MIAPTQENVRQHIVERIGAVIAFKLAADSFKIKVNSLPKALTSQSADSHRHSREGRKISGRLTESPTLLLREILKLG
jgi:hypothetical protein